MKQATPVVSRRKAIASAIFGIVSAPAILKALPKNKKYKSGLPLPIGINAGTIRRFNIPLNEQLELASKYGYDAIEIWTPHINAYLESGGKLPEIRAMLADNSIDLCNVIGFAKCMVDDSALRNKSLEEMKRDMSNAASLGAKHIAVTMLGVEKFETERFNLRSKVFRLNRAWQSLRHRTAFRAMGP
ncbi:MAG: sugar phosphate isomerase/epimerase family protein [Bacilli bacterium]